MFEETSANTTTDAYLTNLRQLTEGMTELQCVIERIVQSLHRRGIGVMVDLDGMMQGLENHLHSMSSMTHTITDQLQQLEMLKQAAALLISESNPDQKLTRLLNIILDFSGAERAYILLLDEGGELTVRAAYNWEGEVMRPEAAVYSQSVVRSTLSNGQPIVTMDAQTDTRYNQRNSVIAHVLRSIMCLPLKLHGEIIGVLYADNRIDKARFTENTVKLLLPMADQITGTIALEWAQRLSVDTVSPALSTIDRNGAQRTPRRYEFLPITDWPEHPMSTGQSDFLD
jgi:putative methionine-R-sulfoxide reductase with GAF domain